MQKTKPLKDIFSRSFRTVYSEIENEIVKIDATSINNIPEMIRYWRMEIDKRKKDILEYKSRRLFDRFIDWVGGDERFDDATGDELYKISPSEKAKKLMDRIDENPTDMSNRLKLVALIGKNIQKISVEATRDLFLNATVACCFGKINNRGIMVVLKTQQAYFNQLKTVCQKDNRSLKNVLDSQKTEINDRNLKIIKDFHNRTEKNLNVFDYYLKLTQRGISALQITAPVSLNGNEITSLSKKDDKKASIEKKLLLNQVISLVSNIRFLPLLLTEAAGFLTLLSKLDPGHPLLALVKARIYRARLFFLIKEYESDEPSMDLRKLIKDRFQLTFDSYRLAVLTVKKRFGGEAFYLSHIEYARLILDLYLFYKNRLRSNLPNYSSRYYLEEAFKALNQIKRKKTENELLEKVFVELNKVDQN